MFIDELLDLISAEMVALQTGASSVESAASAVNFHIDIFAERITKRDDAVNIAVSYIRRRYRSYNPLLVADKLLPETKDKPLSSIDLIDICQEIGESNSEFTSALIVALGSGSIGEMTLIELLSTIRKCRDTYNNISRRRGV